MKHSKTLIDLSHVIDDQTITYKGLPAPIMCDFLSREDSKGHYAEGTEFQIGKIEMVGNTGTYIDSPFHRYVDGNDLSELPLESVAELEGVLVNAVGQQAIGPEFFVDVDVRGKAVLVHTGWSQHWGTDQYFEGHSFLTQAAAEYLRDHGAVLVGIDSLNIDDVSGGERPVHTILLEADIPIVEHLCNLDQIGERPFTFSAVPAKVKQFGTFPVRAYAGVKE
ncbi:MAG: cyclase family protein [Chloroflexota bacterium]